MKILNTVLLTFSLLYSSFSYAQDRGELISDTLLATLNKAEIQGIYAGFSLPEFVFPIDYDSLEIHKVVYWTIDAHGNNLIEASGLVTIPVGFNCDFPLMNYNHGTMDYDKLLSDLNASAMQHFVGVPFAANGYASVLPDFLGYGETPIPYPHAYLHAKSEATVVVDIMRVARTFCEAKEVELNDQVFLLGYSQGGHVTMAAHKEFEELHSDEFEITASAPGSSAYDLSGRMLDSMLYNDSFSDPFYFAYTIWSYQFVYGDLYDDISDVFVAPYDSLIPLMFNRYAPEPFWEDSLPTPGYLVLQPDFLNALINDEQHPLRVALQDNDLYDWAPQAPTRLYYCEADEKIPFSNSIFTSEHMASLGATNVAAESAGAIYGHSECGFRSLVSAKLWFETYRDACTPTAIASVSPDKINIYPNPFSDQFYVDASEMFSSRELEVRLYDMMGRQVHSEFFESGQLLSVPQERLIAGTYLLRVVADDQSVSRIIVKGE